MILMIPVLMLIIGVLSVPAWHYANRHRRWSRRDYAFPFVPMVAWAILAGLGVGPQSLANIIELFALTLVVLAALYLRVFALDRMSSNHRRNSLIVLVFTLAVVVALRLLMPMIPE